VTKGYTDMLLSFQIFLISKAKFYYSVISMECGGKYYYYYYYLNVNSLCGLVVRVSGYRYRGPGFDLRRYQIF